MIEKPRPDLSILVLWGLLLCAVQGRAMDTVVTCAQVRAILDAPVGYDFYTWSPTVGLQGSGARVFVFSSESRVYRYEAQRAFGPNLIQNPNFELGNTGFSSDYQYVPGGTTQQASYAILSNPQLFNSNFANCPDAITPGGLMMVVDGSTEEGDRVWCQTITVEANKSYAFGAYLASLIDINPARLSFTINGQRLGGTIAETATCIWRQFFTRWNSGSSTQANICIINTNTAPNGNDFALDRLSFQELTAPLIDSFYLQVNQPRFAVIQEQLCLNQRYQQNGLDLGPNETGQVVLRTYQGCDSALTVRTLLNDSIVTEVRVDTLCAGESFAFEGLILQRDTSICREFTTMQGCDSLFCLTLRFLSANTIEEQIVNPSCPGDADGSIEVLATAGLAPFTYIWDDGTTGRSRQNLSAGTYNVRVEDSRGCVVNTSFEIEDPPAIVIENIISLGVRCANEQNGFAIVIADGGTGALSETAIRNGQEFSVDTLGVGTYTIRVSDENGCFAERQVTIDGPPPVFAELRGDTLIRLGNTGNYRSSASGDSVEVLWRFNGFPIDSLVMGNALDWRPSNDGWLSIFVEDRNGCRASDSMFIRLQPINTEFFPSAFSPNGDGVNDTFGPVPDPAISRILSFRIFDRWGGLLYEVINCVPDARRSCDWKGFRQNSNAIELLDTGVYVYVAELELIDGQQVVREGEVHLFAQDRR